MYKLLKKYYIWFIYWSSTIFSILYFSKSYYVVGAPRSGTNWMCRLISSCVNIPIMEPWNEIMMVTGRRVFHLHRFFLMRRVKNRVVYLIRDGRDVVVSYYFQICSMPVGSKLKNIIADQLPCPLEIKYIRENLPAFIIWWSRCCIASVDYRTHLLKAEELGFMFTRFEDLKMDTVNVLHRIFLFLGEKVDSDQMVKSVYENDISKLKKESPDSTFLRKGEIGDWKNYFCRDAAQNFDQYAGDLLIKFGYESNCEWVRNVSE